MSADPVGYFITWTTYGSWLPGDIRGWRKRIGGPQEPQPLLEQWCRERLSGFAVRLSEIHREKVEMVCGEHCLHRQWELHAVNARSNHVHVVVSAAPKPKTVRDQMKANATRVLREPPHPLVASQIWTKGGDCEVLYDDEELANAVRYVLEGQDFHPLGLDAGIVRSM